MNLLILHVEESLGSGYDPFPSISIPLIPSTLVLYGILSSHRTIVDQRLSAIQDYDGLHLAVHWLAKFTTFLLSRRRLEMYPYAGKVTAFVTSRDGVKE